MRFYEATERCLWHPKEKYRTTLLAMLILAMGLISAALGYSFYRHACERLRHPGRTELPRVKPEDILIPALIAGVVGIALCFASVKGNGPEWMGKLMNADLVEAELSLVSSAGSAAGDSPGDRAEKAPSRRARCSRWWE